MVVRSTEPFHAASPAPGSSGLDGMALNAYDHLLLVVRAALGVIFVVSGYAKLTGLAVFSAVVAARDDNERLKAFVAGLPRAEEMQAPEAD